MLAQGSRLFCNEHCWVDCLFKPDAWNRHKNSCTNHYLPITVRHWWPVIGTEARWFHFENVSPAMMLFQENSNHTKIYYTTSLKKLSLWHTSYFSWTKILRLACFWKKVWLRIKQLSWLDALLYKINWHHCNSILYCSSSFVWRQCSLWITSHQIAYLQQNRNKRGRYFDPHSGNNFIK